jgi:hypothetical protein
LPTGEPAYIAGKFVEENPDSAEMIEGFGLGYYYTPSDSD